MYHMYWETVWQDKATLKDSYLYEQVYRDVLASWLAGEEGQVAMDEPLITNPNCRA